MAQRIANLETFRLDGSRGPHPGRFFRRNRHEDGRNTDCFDSSLNRDNCPMADVRSASRQNYTIGIGPLDFFGYRRDGFFVDFFQTHSVTHQGNLLFGYTTDNPGCG